MTPHTSSRFVATLVLLGIGALAPLYGCGKLAFDPSPPDDLGDASLERGFASEAGSSSDAGRLDGATGRDGSGDASDANAPLPDATPLPPQFGQRVKVIDTEADQLVVDDSRVYWTNFEFAVFDCAIADCAEAGATALPVLSNEGPQAIAVAAGTVYFIDLSTQSISSCPGTGCSASTTYWTDPDVVDEGSQIEEIVNDSFNLYFVDSERIYECPLGTACLSPTVLVHDSGSLAVSGDQLFYAGYYSTDNTISAVPVAGGKSRVVCKAPGVVGTPVVQMVVSGGFLIFATQDYPVTSIYSYPLAGGGASEVFARVRDFTALAADDSNVYWTKNDSVIACTAGKVCGSPVTIATGQHQPGAVAANSTAVFWTTDEGISSASK